MGSDAVYVNVKIYNTRAEIIRRWLREYLRIKQGTKTSFLGLLQSKFAIDKLSKKLENWHELSFGDFLKELTKQKVQLSLTEEAQWMYYFNEQKEKAQTLKAQIDNTDREIDQMVYELYGLTEDGIRIVEEAI